MAGFCTGCGTALQDNVAFCGVCGKATPGAASMRPAEPVAPPPQPAPPPPQPHYTAPPPVPPQQPYQPAPAPDYPPPASSGPNMVLIGLIAVAVLLAGAIVYLLATRGGGTASVAESTRSQAATSAAPVTAGAAQGPEVTKFVTSTTNIRSMATAQDPNSQVVGSLQRGMQVRGVMHQGLAGNSSWLKLSDGRGYVTATNLSDGPPVEQPVVRTALANGQWCNVVTSEGNLRIRSAPGGRIIGGMPRGSRFQSFNEQYDRSGYLWLQIQPAETRYPIGWVSGDHVIC